MKHFYLVCMKQKRTKVSNWFTQSFQKSSESKPVFTLVSKIFSLQLLNWLQKILFSKKKTFTPKLNEMTGTTDIDVNESERSEDLRMVYSTESS